jgi:hypothetical protein
MWNVASLGSYEYERRLASTLAPPIGYAVRQTAKRRRSAHVCEGLTAQPKAALKHSFELHTSRRSRCELEHSDTSRGLQEHEIRLADSVPAAAPHQMNATFGVDFGYIRVEPLGAGRRNNSKDTDVNGFEVSKGTRHGQLYGIIIERQT